jgi:UPF0755 protein
VANVGDYSQQLTFVSADESKIVNDYTLNRILLKHLEIDSPYNTYRYEGLPPGPICVPPKECLEAVLNPDSHGYLYFCASDAMDGTHRFAVSYADHLRNAAAFQRALNARARKNDAI